MYRCVAIYQGLYRDHANKSSGGSCTLTEQLGFIAGGPSCVPELMMKQETLNIRKRLILAVVKRRREAESTIMVGAKTLTSAWYLVSSVPSSLSVTPVVILSRKVKFQPVRASQEGAAHVAEVEGADGNLGQ